MSVHDQVVDVAVVIEKHGGLGDDLHYVVLVIDPKTGEVGIAGSDKDPKRTGAILMTVGISMTEDGTTIQGYHADTGEPANEH